jgi:radical SAM superfamily enzyme YgiQ (UPF0313 family)
MSHIVLINPRFEVTFLGLEHALPLLHKKATMPVSSLPLLAALTPSDHKVTIIDENVEPIDFDRLAGADLVGLTGMIVQRKRMREILTAVKKLNVFTVVGGPWVTVQEDYFGDLPDAVFIGEAEETWPRFLEEWKQGNPGKRYQQEGPSDMTRVPPPRLDLLKTNKYLFGGVQFSRGCPFQCEFCDIIVTFGRRPRFKTAGQVIVELEALRAHGLEVAFIVDDNFVGNRAGTKELLGPVIAWQEKHGYPIIFVAEASLNLAEDPELMELMVAANIQSVFVGIESPSEESLRGTRKYQNISGNRSLVERVRAIQAAGLEVWCGMVLGFDQDTPDVFEAHLDFVRQARISEVMLSMLSAIPKTALHSRLAAEGRLDLDDEPACGTNVLPLKMSREKLRDGFRWLMNELYSPENYFERLDGLLLNDHFQLARQQAVYWRRHPWAGVKAKSLLIMRAAFLFLQLMHNVPDPELRREYRRRILGMARARRDPAVLFGYVLKCAMHYHHCRMGRDMVRDGSPIVNPY